MADIHTAIEDDDINKVQEILTTDPSQLHAIFADITPHQPIHVAAWQDYPEILDLLLEYGADISTRGDFGWTPLHYAAFYGAPATADLLIQHGAPLDILDNDGFSPLFRASRGRDSTCNDVAALLRSHGAVIDLNSAICLGDFAWVHTYLATHPDGVHTARFPGDLMYDAVVAIGTHIVHECEPPPFRTQQEVHQIIDRDLATLQLLIDHGADVNDTGLTSSPALFYAVKMELPTVTEWLLERGADINYRSPSGTMIGQMTPNTDRHTLLRRHGYDGPVWNTD